MGLRIGPAEAARARLRGRVSVTLGGSFAFAGQTWEIKFGIGQSKARDTDLPDGHPARLDHQRNGHAAQEPSFGYAECRQVPSAARPAPGQETHGNSGSPERAWTSDNENKTMVNFWDSINADQKQAFQARAHERVFASGARLMQEGEHGDHVAVILSGLTEIRVCENGAERVVAERGPGQLIGERAALEVNPRSATVVALQPVLALVMRTADFAEFISTYPAVLKIVEDQIFSRLRESRADQHRADQHRADQHRAGAPADRRAGGRAEPARAGHPHIDAIAPRPRMLTGQNCTVVRTDVVEFGAGGRDGESHKIIRQETLDMTRQALGAAWDTCWWEDRGDGLLVIVPPEVPTAQVIERLVTVLPSRLNRHNRTYSASSRIQLRVAVEVGPIEEDEAGVSGTSIIGVSRILDAPAFKRAVADRRAVLGIVVSRYVFQSHVEPGGSFLDPADYAEIPVLVKETRGSAWMQLIEPVRTATSSW